MAAAVNWSALPGPILLHISSYLGAADHARFRSVCSSWRAAGPGRPQFPFLVGSCVDLADSGYRIYHAFFSFDGERLSHRANVPFAVTFCCSSYGWLALLDRCSYGFFLWNPVTGARIQLPPIAHFPNKVILSSSHPEAVSSGCVVLLIYDGWERVSVCRPGDYSWTPMEWPVVASRYHNVNIDGLFYGGHFYLTTGYRIFGSNFPNSVKWLEILKCVDVSKHPEARPLPEPVNECYLVESQKDLLLIIILFCGFYYARIVRVYWAGGKWRKSRVYDLGDRAVFVGRNQSFCACASMLPGCRRNCIYRACDKEKCVLEIPLGCFRNQLLPIPSVDSRPGWRPCAWFTPSLQ